MASISGILIITKEEVSPVGIILLAHNSVIIYGHDWTGMVRKDPYQFLPRQDLQQGKQLDTIFHVFKKVVYHHGGLPLQDKTPLTGVKFVHLLSSIHSSVICVMS